MVAEGKETREFDGRMYVMETALKADVSLVKAWKADKAGNLVFRKTARNFNPACAMAGKVCVAEVEELVEIGDIDPDHVHLPGIYVTASSSTRRRRSASSSAPSASRSESARLRATGSRAGERPALDGRAGMRNIIAVPPWMAATH